MNSNKKTQSNNEKEQYNLAKISVDADNIFSFANLTFRIPYSNKNYRVAESYRNDYNYENKADMDSVFITVEHDDNNKFFLEFKDENGNEILGIKMMGANIHD